MHATSSVIPKDTEEMGDVLYTVPKYGENREGMGGACGGKEVSATP
jgi:hypothetical protein